MIGISDLCTRIAAVAEDHDVEQEGVNYWQCTCGEKFYINQGEYRSWQEHLADAVIAPQRRFVTDWEPDIGQCVCGEHP